MLGKDYSEFEGLGCGSCRLIGPYIQFMSPFCGVGHLEISEGTKGLGTGCIRLCRGPEVVDDFEYMKKLKRNKIPDHELDIFLIPFRHIGE